VIGKDGTVLKKFEGFDQDLIPQLKELLGLKPPATSKEYTERGYKLYDYMSNLEKALADFDKAIELDPINSTARCGRGEVLVDMGKKEQGIKDLLRAIELSKANTRAYMNLGYQEEQQRNYEKALEWYKAGAENNPDDKRMIDTRDTLANKIAILNTPAPDFTVKTLSGEEITLSALKGNKAVIIDSWATWCGPCRMEMPKLQEFYNKHSDKVEIIAVSNETELKTITDFIEKEGFTFKIVQDTAGVVKEKYPSKYIPFLTIISKDGLIIETFTGYNEKIIEELEKLLEL
jgi:tetratricopeptide (TPR) repeat protein